MALKILITNDDGIYAEGIKLLVDEAKKYGSVMVVAPKVEQSGMSHALTLRKPMQIKKIKLFDGTGHSAVLSNAEEFANTAKEFFETTKNLAK